ncbi:hypothetical protein SEA_SIRVICTOR_52 [Microbacterium phage SirVictor]|nr:hypothetical protein SEA_SIRVICTOR_52 [Microbacterium phage SirVictor]WNM74395.1 hypothetical protein SEA_GUETZIE_52 [Microbacterium phage Guetzie]
MYDDRWFVEWLLRQPSSWPHEQPEPVPNTFRSNPQPREGFVDARRDDGCIPSITVLEDISIAC